LRDFNERRKFRLPIWDKSAYDELGVLRGEHCDLFFTTEGTEFTEKAETQQVGAWGEERGASSENVPDAEFLVHRGFLRELRVLRGDDCD